MQQLITTFNIKLINYTNNENFPSYKDGVNITPLTTKLIVNNLEYFNQSNNTITIEPDREVTLYDIKYLYLKVLDDNTVSINSDFLTSEFLFNSISNTLSSTFIIGNKSLVDPVKIEYYCLTN